MGNFFEIDIKGNLNSSSFIGKIINGTGTISASGTSVTGTGTKFTKEIEIGNFIVVASTPYLVTSITDDTNLTISSTGSFSNVSFTIQKNPAIFKDNTGAILGAILNNGKVGIGTSIPTVPLEIKTLSGDNVLRLNNAEASSRIWDLVSNLGGTFSIYDRTANTSRLVIDGAGKIGVWTNTPEQALHINGSTASGSGLLVQGNTRGGLVADFRYPGTGAGGIVISGYADGAKALYLHNIDDTTVRITKDDGTQAGSIYLKSNGRVGLGTSSPEACLHIYSANAIATMKFTGAYDGGRVWIMGDGIYDNGEFTLWNATNARTCVSFKISGGNMFMGVDRSGPAYPIHSSTGAYLTTSGIWTNASDIAYKTNITNIKYGLKTVLELCPREFDMVKDNSHQIGFVAQEVEKIIPEVVSGKEGEKGLSYGNLTAVLVKAIQEQQVIIEELKQRVAKLEEVK